MAVSAKDVMQLRQKTGLGMMECKKALEETHGDADAAIQLLRERLGKKMEERADRSAAEGVIAAAVDAGAAAMVELNTETDFTARNEAFVEAGDKVAQIALAKSDGPVEADDQINQVIEHIRITTKENASYRRGVRLSGEKVGLYVHHNRQIGVIVAAEGDVDDATLTGVCQHIAAHVPTPLAVDEAGLPEDQKAQALEQAKQEAIDSGKPENIAEKIAQGKYDKWVAENTLLGQQYVKDMEGKSTVGDQLKGGKITDFARYVVGVDA